MTVYGLFLCPLQLCCLDPLIIASKNAIVFQCVQWKNNHKLGKRMQPASHRQRDATFEGPKLTKNWEIKQNERRGRIGERLWIIITLEKGVKKKKKPASLRPRSKNSSHWCDIISAMQISSTFTLLSVQQKRLSACVCVECFNLQLHLWASGLTTCTHVNTYTCKQQHTHCFLCHLLRLRNITFLHNYKEKLEN